jgi:hypothetical protein
MRVLGIESSCDETAASVVEDGFRLLSNVIASSADLQAQYGGVVPEIAARSHIEAVNGVVQQALDDAALHLGRYRCHSRHLRCGPRGFAPDRRADGPNAGDYAQEAAVRLSTTWKGTYTLTS